jgi:hypothetical protein
MLLSAAECRCGGARNYILQTRLDGVVLVKLSGELAPGLLGDLDITASRLRNQNVPGMHPANGTIVRLLVLVDLPLGEPPASR